MNHDDAATDLTDALGDDLDRAVIDALLDGEGVTRASLSDALGRAEIRDYFIDTLLLRRMAIEMGPDTFRSSGVRSTRAARAARWAAAAAVLVATATASYVAGRENQPVALSSGPAVTMAAPVEDAPAPTRTVRFERGRNWVSNPGEN